MSIPSDMNFNMVPIMQFNIGKTPPHKKSNKKPKHNRDHKNHMDYTLTPNPNALTDFLFSTIMREFGDKNYKKMYKYINSIMNNDFMTTQQKQKVKDRVLQFRRARWLKMKFVHKLNKIKMMKRIPINKTFLDLDDVNPDANDYIRFQTKNTVYAFKPADIIGLFSSSFALHDYTDPTPKIAKNPYTSIEFTLGEIVYLFDQLTIRGIKLPLMLEIYKTTRYNFDKFCCMTYEILEENATREYIESLDMTEFIDIIHENAGNMFVRRVCDHFTYNNIRKYRKELEVVLIKVMTDQTDEFPLTIEYTNSEWSEMHIGTQETFPEPPIGSDIAKVIDLIENHEIDGPPYDESDSDDDSDDETPIPPSRGNEGVVIAHAVSNGAFTDLCSECETYFHIDSTETCSRCGLDFCGNCIGCHNNGICKEGDS